MLIALLLLGLLVMPAGMSATHGQAQAGSRLFPETGKRVQGKFLRYWETHGGLAQQGYPISGELLERSSTDGKMYTVQYFERAVFELHPENQPPYDVLLSLLGVFEFKRRYPNGAGGQTPSADPNGIFFPNIQKRLGGPFLRYWQEHGGLAQQGYPLTEEFDEKNELDGKTYRVQYFERAVFEYHPENAGTPHEVLLSHLGKFRLRQMYVDAPPIVPPHRPDAAQYGQQVSDNYLVWAEYVVSGMNLTYSEIFALDLRTNKRVHVTEGRPGEKSAPRISGSLVAWGEKMSCLGCTADVMARDLSTGEFYVVADGPDHQYLSDVFGSTVLWLGTAITTGNTTPQSKLMLRDVRTNAVDQIPLLRGAGVSQINDRYIVWREGADCKRTAVTYFRSCIFVFDRSTREIRGVATSSSDTFGVHTTRFVLSDKRLFIVEGHDTGFDLFEGCPCKYYIMDLETGARTDLPDLDSSHMPHGTPYGDYLVWEKREGRSIWALDLRTVADPRPKTYLLVSAKSWPHWPDISGDWLSWGNRHGPSVMPFSALLATSDEREKAQKP
jgi:hypothetical protein